jgi:hypothetical protein
MSDEKQPAVERSADRLRAAVAPFQNTGPTGRAVFASHSDRGEEDT